MKEKETPIVSEPIHSAMHDDFPDERLSPSEQSTLLRVARQAVRAAVERASAPMLAAEHCSAGLVLPRACFVTLRKGKELRGCIGQLAPHEPLWEAVVKNAEGAAVRDYRFSAVTPPELDALRIEISVLSPAVVIEFDTPANLLAQLQPGIDGVVLRIGGSVSTFLPQVWEDLPEKERFMNHLARKAGLADGAWRDPGVVVERYWVQHFRES